MDKLIKILINIREGIDYQTESALITNKLLDSIDLVALMGDLEDEYGIEITYDMLTAENFDSVYRIWELIKNLQTR